MKQEHFTVQNMIKHLFIRKPPKKRVLYELIKPYPRYDENLSEYDAKKPKLYKVQKKEYGDYWIKRETNYQIHPYVMPLKRKSQVPRMDRIKPYSGAGFSIKESGGNMQTDFVMSGSINKNGKIVNINKMRNGFVEHIWWDKYNVRQSKTSAQVFNVD